MDIRGDTSAPAMSTMNNAASPTVSESFEFPEQAQVGYLHPYGHCLSPVWLNVSFSPIGTPEHLARQDRQTALETAQRTFYPPPIERPMSKTHMALATCYVDSPPIRLRCEPDPVQPNA